MQLKDLSFHKTDLIDSDICRRAVVIRFILITPFAIHAIVHAKLIQMLMTEVKPPTNEFAGFLLPPKPSALTVSL